MTLREIHERCKARHTPWIHPGMGTRSCLVCDVPYPCPDYSDAVAALAILDAATPVRVSIKGQVRNIERMVDDPLSGGGA